MGMFRISFMLIFIFLSSISIADTRIDICDRGEIGKQIAKSLGYSCRSVSKKEMSNLTGLNLKGIGIDAIPMNAFLGLDSLLVLSLDDNSISSFNEKAFEGLSSLEKLTLRNNELIEIPERVFKPLRSLKHLELHSNKLDLEKVSFNGLLSLETLYLTDNSLTVIPNSAFSKLPALKTLVLAYNNLSGFSNETFSGVEHLESLSLGNNSFRSIPSGLSNLVSLKGLYLNNNKVEVISKSSLKGLRSLESLSLKECKITEIEEGTFVNLDAVRWINLRFNPIDDVFYEDIGICKEARILGVTTYRGNARSCENNIESHGKTLRMSNQLNLIWLPGRHSNKQGNNNTFYTLYPQDF